MKPFKNTFIEFVSQTLWYDSYGAAKLLYENPFFFLKSCSVDSFHRVSSLLSR